MFATAVFTRRILVAASAALCACAAGAQSAYPNKPIRLIVGYNTGASTDAVARELAKGLTDRLGVPVIVENKSGANTIIATNMVAKAPADGYTLLVSNSSNASNPWVYSNLPYDWRKGLQNIVLAGITYNLVTVSPKTGINNVKKLIAAAKRKPGDFSYGSVGIGSAQHLLMSMFSKQAGIELNHIPYRGAVAAMQDVLGGTLNGMIGSITSQRELAIKGSLKPVFVTSEKRSKFMPQVETLAENGFPSIVSGYWIGLSGPAGMPREVVEKINAAVNQMLKTPEVLERFAFQSLEPMGGTPADMDKYFENELNFWKDAAVAANIVPVAVPAN